MEPIKALFRSRKFLLALFGVIQALAFNYFDVPDDVWQSITVLVMVLIASIAYEDGQAKSGASNVQVQNAAPQQPSAFPFSSTSTGTVIYRGGARECLLSKAPGHQQGADVLEALTLGDFLRLLPQITGTGALILVLWAILNGHLVPGYVYQAQRERNKQLEARNDALFDLTLKATGLADQATNVAAANTRQQGGD